ncbi:hypothetical protein BV898_12909, partial [Hypsibius exemplaris]
DYYSSYPSYPNCLGFIFNRLTDQSYIQTNSLSICPNLCVIYSRCSAVMYRADSGTGKQQVQCWI